MDVGCSTGGFSDCLLQNGAQCIYAIDVGYGQFDLKLRKDKRVVLIERTNIRYLDTSLIKNKIDVIVIDVSFISIRKFLHDLLPLCDDNFSIIVLIKPQFEAEKESLEKGVVKSKSIHLKTINQLFDYFLSIGLYIHDFTYSPVKGPKGNIEFLVHLKSKKVIMDDNIITQVVNQAHEM